MTFDDVDDDVDVSRYRDSKKRDCLLTHWLSTKSILFLILTIERYQFRWNYLRNKKLFLTSLLNFRKLGEIFNILNKKMTLTDFVFPNLPAPKTWSDKCLKSPVSEDPLTSNMENEHSTFIISIDHCQVNWVGQSLSYWHAKSWDCLLTHWLPMKSIMFLTETI